MLSGEEEIYAHFSGMGLDDSLEVTQDDLWITVNIRLLETIDKTTDGSCNDNEDYKKSGILEMIHIILVNFSNAYACLFQSVCYQR